MIDYLENPKPRLAKLIIAAGHRVSCYQDLEFYEWKRLGMYIGRDGDYLIWFVLCPDWVKYLSSGKLEENDYD